MRGGCLWKCLCTVTCIMILVATLTSAAPSYADYDDELRELMETLSLNREPRMENRSRKSERSPTLRLRFGRRSDPSLSADAAFLMGQLDHDN